jgi:hypothetical protein
MKLLDNFEARLDGGVDDFIEKLKPAASANLDFTGAQASGLGRTFIRNKILEELSMLEK